MTGSVGLPLVLVAAADGETFAGLPTEHVVLAMFGVAVLAPVVRGATGLVNWVLQLRRQGRLAAWAHATGWTYLPIDAGSGLAMLQTGRPFGQGSKRVATEVLTGTYDGLSAVSFTYLWTTGGGRRRRTERAHVVGVALPAHLPVLELTAEHVGTRLGRALGAQDLHLESDAFNAEYRVVAADPRTAHAILHPRMLERLLQSDALGLAWRIEGTWLLSWEPGATDTARIAPCLGLLSAVVRGIPRHVWQDHGYDPGR